MARSSKLRRAALLGVTVAVGALACGWLDRTADARLAPYEQQLRGEQARNGKRVPRAVIGRAAPGDARVALESLLLAVQPLELTSRAKVATGEPLTQAELAQLDAWRPHFAELHAALGLDSHTRPPLPGHIGDGPHFVPIFPALKLHAALAIEGERALAEGLPAEGTAMILDALALGLEIGHRGDLISVVVSASMIRSSAAQIERRFRDLDAPQLAALSTLRFHAGEQPFSSARLHELNTVFLAATEGPGDNVLERIPFWRKWTYAAELEPLDRFYQAAALEYEAGDGASCERALAASPPPQGGISAEMLCDQATKIREAAAAFSALRARASSG